MIKKTLVVIIIIFTNQIFSQKKPTLFFEYGKSEDTNLVIINIKTPLSIIDIKDIVTDVDIKMKSAQFLMINFLRRKSKINDTCYIATYIESDWVGLDPEENEKGCEIDKYDCNFLIMEDKNHIIRYRTGRKTKSYRLILKK